MNLKRPAAGFLLGAMALGPSCGGASDGGGEQHTNGATAGTSATGGSAGSNAAGRANGAGRGGSGADGAGGSNGASAGTSSAGISSGGASAGAPASGGSDAGSGGHGAGTAGRTGGSGGDESLGGAGLGGAAGNSGGSAGLTPCDTACEDALNFCCDEHCVNLKDDPFNCGVCGNHCTGGTPLCSNGACVIPPCDSAEVCPATGSNEPRTCCGSVCCKGAQICCEVPGPISMQATCVDPAQSEGTCPRGCNACRCAAPDTPIATPGGERAIATLRVGDLVYSTAHGAVVTVAIREVHREPVTSRHHVARVTLENGAVLDVSPGHPTSDGRLFSDVRAGDRLGDVRVVRVEPSVAYDHAFTYDILPDSPTGGYFAAGALIGSTLATGQCDP